MRLISTIVCALLTVHLIGNPADALRNALTTKALSEGADLIVLGRVTDLSSAWNSQRTEIRSTATRSVEEVLKGNPGDAITFSFPGGV